MFEKYIKCQNFLQVYVNLKALADAYKDLQIREVKQKQPWLEAAKTTAECVQMIHKCLT